MHSVISHWTDRELIDELCGIDSGLNDWERSFVTDIIKRVFVYKDELSPAMRAKAEDILGKFAE